MICGRFVGEKGRASPATRAEEAPSGQYGLLEDGSRDGGVGEISDNNIRIRFRGNSYLE